jgi:Ca2+-binding RTX toxin-like protein
MKAWRNAIGVALLILTAQLALSGAAAVAKPPKCQSRAATIVGTKGDDKLTGTPRADVIVGLGGGDELYGKGGNDWICAGPGGDFLSGGHGNDRLYSGGGNNSLSGDAGNDVLQGGPGSDDDADYLHAPRGVFASIAKGFARGQGHDTILPRIDELFGSIKHGDTLIGDGRPQLLAGLGGNDTIKSGAGDDLLAGGAGDDRIDGGRGAYDLLEDIEFGGPGAQGPVRLDLGAGIEQGHGTDRLKGIEGTDGTEGDDVLIGGPGREILIASKGNDVIAGGGGPDLLEGGVGLDQLDGGPGIDYSSSYTSETAVTVNLAAGTLTGADPATDNDTLVNIEDVGGSSFGDTIIGDAGPNALRGDVGADTIMGGGGDDLLIGDCSAAPKPHFFFEDVFDCSKKNRPDTLDGGLGTDRCKDGESVAACESGPKGNRWKK